MSMSSRAPVSPFMPCNDETARYLGLQSVSGLRKWIYGGIIPADVIFQARPKGRVMLNRAKLERWMESRV